MPKILLGVTGSVASIYTPQLAVALRDAGHDVQVVATKASLYFFDAAELGSIPLHRDQDEWPGERYRRGDPVLHIELRRWADVLLIAPLDANTLGKLAYGLADNCLTCVWRAWDPAKPRILAPAMNTLMWQHPTTLRQVRELANDAWQDVPKLPLDEMLSWINGQPGPLRIVPPITKRLACDDVGVGAMAEREAIIAAVGLALAGPC